MNTYALVRNGSVVNMVTTAGTATRVRERFPDFQVVPAHLLTPRQKSEYPYWDTRPTSD